MPTSMTYAPGLIQSPRIISVRPIAAITISPDRTTPGRSLVFEWQIVTVAFSLTSRSAAGMPTMFERPTTTALAPSSLAPAFLRRTMHPAGVQGTNNGSPPLLGPPTQLGGVEAGPVFILSISL